MYSCHCRLVCKIPLLARRTRPSARDDRVSCIQTADMPNTRLGNLEQFNNQYYSTICGFEAIFGSLSPSPHPVLPPLFPVTLTTLKDFILYNDTFLHIMFTLALDLKLSHLLIDDKAFKTKLTKYINNSSTHLYYCCSAFRPSASREQRYLAYNYYCN